MYARTLPPFTPSQHWYFIFHSCLLNCEKFLDSVGPEPRSVCMKCPLTFSTILTSTSSEVFRGTRCLFCSLRHFPPDAPKGRQGHTPLGPDLGKWRTDMQFHLVCLTPPGGLLLKKTFKLRGHFMHTGPHCGTRLRVANGSLIGCSIDIIFLFVR